MNLALALQAHLFRLGFIAFLEREKSSVYIYYMYILYILKYNYITYIDTCGTCVVSAAFPHMWPIYRMVYNQYIEWQVIFSWHMIAIYIHIYANKKRMFHLGVWLCMWVLPGGCGHTCLMVMLMMMTMVMMMIMMMQIKKSLWPEIWLWGCV